MSVSRRTRRTSSVRTRSYRAYSARRVGRQDVLRRGSIPRAGTIDRGPPGRRGLWKIAESLCHKAGWGDNLRRRQMKHSPAVNSPAGRLRPPDAREDTGEKEESRMKFLSRTLEVRTERGPQFVDITDRVEEAALECGLRNGFRSEERRVGKECRSRW